MPTMNKKLSSKNYDHPWDQTSTKQQVDITPDLKFPSWPMDENSTDNFCFDDDGWNVYNHDDQVGSDWYSFIEQPSSSSVHDVTFAITGFYDDFDDDDDDDDNDNDEVGSRQEPIFRRRMDAKLHNKSSPAKKFRSSLSKLACVLPSPTPATPETRGDSSIDDLSPVKRYGAERNPEAPVRDAYDDDDDLSSDVPTPSKERTHYNWMHKSNLFHEKGMIMSKRELDRYCQTDVQSNKITTKTNRSRTKIGDASSTRSSSSSSSSKASSIANCDIHDDLAKALSFHDEVLSDNEMHSYGHAPASKSVKPVTGSFYDEDSPTKESAVDNYGRALKYEDSPSKENEVQNCDDDQQPKATLPTTPLKSVGECTQKVADRHKWLTEAFTKKAASPIAVSEERKSEIASKIKMFGTPVKKGVARKKDEWERKLAQQESAKQANSKKTFKKGWKSHDRPGNYKQTVVLKATE